VIDTLDLPNHEIQPGMGRVTFYATSRDPRMLELYAQLRRKGVTWLGPGRNGNSNGSNGSAHGVTWVAQPVGEYTIRARVAGDPAGGKFVLVLRDNSHNRATRTVGAYASEGAAKKAAGLDYRDMRTQTDPRRRARTPPGIWGETEQDWRRRYDEQKRKREAEVERDLGRCKLHWEEYGAPGQHSHGFEAPAPDPAWQNRWSSYMVSYTREYKSEFRHTPAYWSLIWVHAPAPAAAQRAARQEAELPPVEEFLAADGQVAEDLVRFDSAQAAMKAATNHCRRLVRPSGRSAARKPRAPSRPKAKAAPKPKRGQKPNSGVDTFTLRRVHTELAREFAPDAPTVLSIMDGLELYGWAVTNPARFRRALEKDLSALGLSFQE